MNTTMEPNTSFAVITSNSIATTTSAAISSTTMESDVNSTSFYDNPFRDMPLDSNFAWLLCALTCVCIWMVYGSCLHSRVFGALVGAFLNQYFKRNKLGELKIGESAERKYRMQFDGFQL